MAEYFDFETAFEFTDDDVRDMLKKNPDRKFILASQPHGVLSFCGMSAAAVADPDIGRIHTAAASVLLSTPILKNIMGIFGLVDASRKSLQKHFQKPGIDGCIVLYVGGIAELFKSSLDEERLFLSERKGFIKLALREGVDVVPAYLFGNTTTLSVLKHGPLADLSRKIQVSLTYVWGKWYLPIPRDTKVRKVLIVFLLNLLDVCFCLYLFVRLRLIHVVSPTFMLRSSHQKNNPSLTMKSNHNSNNNPHGNKQKHQIIFIGTICTSKAHESTTYSRTHGRRRQQMACQVLR